MVSYLIKQNKISKFYESDIVYIPSPYICNGYDDLLPVQPFMNKISNFMQKTNKTILLSYVPSCDTDYSRQLRVCLKI